MQYSHGRRPAQASPHILTALLKAGIIRVIHYYYIINININNSISIYYHLFITYYCSVLIGLLYEDVVLVISLSEGRTRWLLA